MYKLHHDPDALRVLINQISLEHKILPEILEKDYFVTLMLYEVSKKQKDYNVYFKGGTALYKALKTINRFSEDIDLTLNDSNIDSNRGKKTVLKKVTSGYTCLPIEKNHIDSVSTDGSRTSIYTYKSMFSMNNFRNDRLNRIGTLKVETTSFTASSPITEYKIEPVVYTYANEEFKQLLENDYKVQPFFIQCITIERIFIDKLFAIEDYHLGEELNRLIEMSKHMYDVYQLFVLPEIQEFMANDHEVGKIVKIKEEEQTRRRGAKTLGKKIHQFEYFEILDNFKTKSNFLDMQNLYVFTERDKIDYENVLISFRLIFSILKEFGI